MYNYIENRKNSCERQILKGNILGTESEIPSPSYVNWLDKQTVKKNSHLIDNLQLYSTYKAPAKKVVKEYYNELENTHKSILASMQEINVISASISSNNLYNMPLSPAKAVEQLDLTTLVDNSKIKTNVEQNPF
jgi:hypothetical protein